MGYIYIYVYIYIIVPITHNKKGLTTEKYNYKPIVITSIVSKILELLFWGQTIPFQLETSSNQFGFKSKQGTDMCVQSQADNRIL